MQSFVGHGPWRSGCLCLCRPHRYFLCQDGRSSSPIDNNAGVGCFGVLVKKSYGATRPDQDCQDRANRPKRAPKDSPHRSTLRAKEKLGGAKPMLHPAPQSTIIRSAVRRKKEAIRLFTMPFVSDVRKRGQFE